MGMRFDLVVLFVTLSAATFAVSFRGILETRALAFTLQNITDVVVFFSVCMRFWAELTNYMTSGQRIENYIQIKSEDDLIKALDEQVINNRDGAPIDAQWPYKGGIKFEAVSMKYRESLEPSVRNLSFEIQPGMKIGIVGRTGAGKSSILQILFRLTEICEGKVSIDGVDTKTLGLHLLRKNIAYIP
jgi:ABC-type multidrug transport system fused ATPase/permease subunit